MRHKRFAAFFDTAIYYKKYGVSNICRGQGQTLTGIVTNEILRPDNVIHTNEKTTNSIWAMGG